MPLRAEWNGENVFSVDYSPEEWRIFRLEVEGDQGSLVMPCCGNRACLRTSSTGLQHFYHYRRGNCDVESESEEHLRLKREVLEACRKAGFSAATEVSGDGWRADVFVEYPDSDWDVAFEIQLSSQTPEETEKRQKRLHKSNVRTCWLFNSEAPNWGRKIPAFKLSHIAETRDDESHVELPRDKEVTVFDFVRALLTGGLVWKNQRKCRWTKRLVIYPYHCGRCQVNSYVYFRRDRGAPVSCDCGFTPGGLSACMTSQTIPPWSDEFDESMIQAVHEYIDEHQLEAAPFKRRSNNLWNKPRVSFGCHKCDSAFAKCGTSVRRSEVDGRQEHIIEVGTRETIEVDGHWCYDTAFGDRRNDP